MQHGDLATHTRQRLLIVLEGVLATVVPITKTHRWKADEVTGWNVLWHETPLKRMVYINQNYPDLAVEVITFTTEEVAEIAADFLNDVPIPYSEIRYQALRQFTAGLPYQTGITQILDSAPDRLDQYGQMGRAVLLGGDI